MRVDVVQPIENVAVAVDAPDSVINLFDNFDDPFTTGQVAVFELNNPEEFSNNGQIELLLFDQPGAGAPIAVERFSSLASDGSFDDLAVNRGQFGFVIQAGQFTLDPETFAVDLVPPVPTIPGEPSPARSNTQGTIAFALSGGDPNSATSQFFLNLGDNSFLDPTFTSFGEVLSAADFAVVDEIANDPVFAPFQDGGGATGFLPPPTSAGDTFGVDDPSEVISFANIAIVEQEELTFTAISSNPDLVVPSIDGGNLSLDFVDGQTGLAEVTVEATNLLGDSTTETFFVGVGDDVELPAEGPPNGVEVIQPLEDVVVGANAADSVIDLFANFDDPFTTGQVATFEVNDPAGLGNNGQIQVLLFDQEGAGSPIAVANFASFVNSGAFDNLAINRGDLGPFEDDMGFLLQAGIIAIDPETFEIAPVPVGPDIQFPGEPSPDLSNLPGTLAFELPLFPGTSIPNPDAPTNLFSTLSFNLTDNSALDAAFNVFGEVLSPTDFEVVDAIANDPIFAPFQGPVTGVFEGGGFLPIQVTDPVTGEDIPDMFVVDDPSEVLFFSDISIAQQDELTFTATSSNPELVVPSVDGGNLTLDFADSQLGTAEVTVEATNLLGDTTTETFSVEVTDEVIPPDVEPDEPDVELDPGTIVVDTLVDEADGSVTDGDASLRDALAAVEPGNTIVFAEELVGEIALNGTELVIDRAVTIEGDGDIIINAGGQSRVFLIGDGDPDTQDPVTLSGLFITGGVADIGGGINSSDSDLTLVNSIVSGNLATTAIPGVLSGNGGGIAIGFGSLNLVDSIVSDNAADVFGGGVFGIAESPLDISDSIISGNSAADGGAIAGVDPLAITGSTISDNSATSTGGGILIPAAPVPGSVAGPVTITNSTIANNSATTGGGIYNAGGQADITNSTITANIANTGSGISSFGDAIAQTTITSSIVSGNSGPDVDLAAPPNVDVAAAPNSFTSNGNNLIGTGSAIDAFNGTGDITGNTDPGLAALADNGGPTPTIAVLPGSPAIDAGSNPNNLGTDQRGTGFSRVVGAAADIGAFEVGAGTADDPASAPDTPTPGGPVNLNVDNSGEIVPSVDVLNIFRVLAGAPQAVVVPDGGSQQAITDVVNAFPELGLDVDGSGDVVPAVDVLNIFRVLAGAPQAVVIPDGVGASQQDVVDTINALVA